MSDTGLVIAVAAGVVAAWAALSWAAGRYLKRSAWLQSFHVALVIAAPLQVVPDGISGGWAAIRDAALPAGVMLVAAFIGGIALEVGRDVRRGRGLETVTEDQAPSEFDPFAVPARRVWFAIVLCVGVILVAVSLLMPTVLRPGPQRLAAVAGLVCVLSLLPPFVLLAWHRVRRTRSTPREAAFGYAVSGAGFLAALPSVSIGESLGEQAFLLVALLLGAGFLFRQAWLCWTGQWRKAFQLNA